MIDNRTVIHEIFQMNGKYRKKGHLHNINLQKAHYLFLEYLQYGNLHFIFQKFFIWEPFDSIYHCLKKFYALNLQSNFSYLRYLNTYLLIHDHENRMTACNFSLKYLCETSLYKSIFREFIISNFLENTSIHRNIHSKEIVD